jgi:hypothetical protein
MSNLDLNYEEITKKQRKQEKQLRSLEQNLKYSEAAAEKQVKMIA